MSKIDYYNREVQNWNFEKGKLPEFLKLLTERNLFVQEQTPLTDFNPDCDKLSVNTSVISSERIELLEHIAFHTGFPHQRRLYTLIDEQTGSCTNEGVFFSLKPKDAVYFSEFNDNPLSMVYFLDINSAKGVKVQTNYNSPVISRHDLGGIINLTPIEGKEDKDNLKIIHKKLNEEWIRKNTTPFDVKRLEEFKIKGYDWLVISDPINVEY